MQPYERLIHAGFAAASWISEPTVDLAEKARELWETDLAKYLTTFGYQFSNFTFHIPPQAHEGSEFEYYIDGDRVDNEDTAVYVPKAPAGAVASWHYHKKGSELYYLEKGAARLNGVPLPLRKVVVVPPGIIHNATADTDSLLILRTTGIRGVPKEEIHTKLDPKKAREMGLAGKNAFDLIAAGIDLPFLSAN